MNNILITTSSFAKNDPALLSRLEAEGLHIELNPFGRTLTEAEVSSLILKHNPVGIIAGVEPLTAKVIQQAAGLRVISRCGIGMGNVDIKTAEKSGIKVVNTPDAPVQAVAELTIALILNLVRRVQEADRNIRRGEWQKLMGRLIGEMTIGIIGCGRIGLKVAEYLRVFGCRIIGTDPNLKESSQITMVSIQELLAESDIMTFHVPLLPETVKKMNDDFIEAMKPGGFIVNTSRGEIIDEQALVRGLDSGKIAGAALDVFSQEPYQGKLINYDNVLLTAHMGSYAREARMKMELQAVENLLSGLGG